MLRNLNEIIGCFLKCFDRISTEVIGVADGFRMFLCKLKFSKYLGKE